MSVLPETVAVRNGGQTLRNDESRKPERCSDLRLSAVGRGGVEPPTFHFSGGRSYQLSYLPPRSAFGTLRSARGAAPSGPKTRASIHAPCGPCRIGRRAWAGASGQGQICARGQTLASSPCPIRPAWAACKAACVRLCTPSLLRMLLT